MLKMTESMCKRKSQTITVNVNMNLRKYDHKSELQNEGKCQKRQKVCVNVNLKQ